MSAHSIGKSFLVRTYNASWIATMAFSRFSARFPSDSVTVGSAQIVLSGCPIYREVLYLVQTDNASWKAAIAFSRFSALSPAILLL